MRSIISFVIILFSTELLGAFAPRSFEAHYQQKHKSRISKRVRISTGVLSYLYPGFLKFEVLTPNPEMTLCTPQKTYIYTPPIIKGEKGQLIIKQTGTIAPAKFFDYLQRDLKSNKRFKVSWFQNYVELTFTPKISKKTELKSARLYFAEGKKRFKDIKRVVIRLLNGKDVEIELTSINLTKTLTKKDFQFNIPPNTFVQK